ncbi:type VI secretion system tube protein Hcp [Lampropedia aestuarii]|uniref:Type VI secretion system tube protein Hcp n=1 Tax=Lampropedia aestuarii TaxID=2562762 RepID=A0A4S5BTX5_9BURK|nr:type VI secretion system tube protein Hcp [Lampropedia aestuarii]
MASLQDFFIKIDGISGESKDSKHAGWIDVLSFSYGVSQSSSSFTGGGAGVGKANFDATVVQLRRLAIELQLHRRWRGRR